MSRCIKCGKEAVRTEQYFVGSKDIFSMVKFEGAARIGICGDCARPSAQKRLNKQLLTGIGAFAIGLFFLIVALTQGGFKGNFWAFGFMVLGLGGGVMSILNYMAVKKKLSQPDQFIKEMEVGDYNEVVAKVLDNVTEIKDEVIVNWEALNARRNIADFSNPAFLASIQTPFKIGTNGSVVLERIKDRSLVPGCGTDKSLDKGGQELIKVAVQAGSA